MFAGKYQIRALLGRGPLGWTYRATEPGAASEVVLKVIDPRYVHLPNERRVFAASMARALRLRHRHIARVLASGEDAQGMPYVVSETVDGPSLRGVMELRRQKGERFSFEEIGPVVAQIAAALDAASPELVHGNLKPDNVLLLPDRLLLTDFGLAPTLPRATFLAAQKQAGVPQYVAPEFLAGAPLDARTDVFSLGVIVAELLCGAFLPCPFSAGALGLPPALERCCLRATAAHPERRFATAGELSRELERACAAPAAEEAEVEILESGTDPRLRIARALGAARA